MPHARRGFPLMPAAALKMLSSPSALWDGKENPPLSRNDASTSKWIFWSRESGSFFLLQRVSCEGCGLTPLYILQVSLAGPRTTVEAQAFYRMYTLTPTSRIHGTVCVGAAMVLTCCKRGCRHGGHGGMALSGSRKRHISPQLYAGTCGQARRPLRHPGGGHSGRLHLFLHRGGGDFLRRYREAKGWNRQQLADHAKVSRTSIRCWESGQKTISQKCFCHLVENLGSDFPSMLRM